MLAVIGPAFALDTEKGVDFMLTFSERVLIT
jgi:hypothetical protein